MCTKTNQKLVSVPYLIPTLPHLIPTLPQCIMQFTINYIFHIPEK